MPVDGQARDSAADRWRAVGAYWATPYTLTERRSDDWQILFGTDASSSATSVKESWRDLAMPFDGIVGVGRAGLHFMSQKVDTSPDLTKPQHGRLIVDSAHGLLWLDEAVVAWPPDPVWLRRILVDDGVVQLVVSGHGDGGHIDLGPLVGCGVTIDIPRRLPSGEPTDECIAGHRCVRSRGNLDRVVLCRDIKVHQAVLIVCKTGLLTDSLRPSTTNAALALLDGYTHGILAPNGRCSASPAITRGIGALSDAFDLGAVRAYLDSVSGGDQHIYRLLGRPDAAFNRPVDTAPFGVTVYNVPRVPDSLAWWSGDGPKMIPGRDATYGSGYLVLPVAADPATVTVRANTTPLEEAGAHWRRGIDSVRLVTSQLKHCFGSLPISAEKKKLHINRLEQKSQAVPAAVMELLERHAAAQAHGFAMHMRLPFVSQPILEAMNEWQGACSDIIECVLPDSDPIALLCRGLWLSKRRMSYNVCTACGGDVAVSTLEDPTSSHKIKRVDCHICGQEAISPVTPLGCWSAIVDPSRHFMNLQIPTAGSVIVSVTNKATGKKSTARHECVQRIRLDLESLLGASQVAASVKVAAIAQSFIAAWKIRV